ncbi:MAG: hypothetical protein NVSMB70_11750 [Chamaesiphon sp.]
MKKQQILSLMVAFIVSGCESSPTVNVNPTTETTPPNSTVSSPPVSETLLTRAEIYKLVKNVQLSPRNQGVRPAKISDVIVPLDVLKTGAFSRADLLFNEGSLTRIGEKGIFRFFPGTRRFQILNGTLLSMFPRDSQGGTIVTPEAKVETHGTALWVRRDSARKTTFVGVLTNNSHLPVIVSNLKGKVTVRLRGGQRVSVINGVVGTVKDLNLQKFYQSCKVAKDLGAEQEKLAAQENPRIQETLNAVRAETLATLKDQLMGSKELATKYDNFIPCPTQNNIRDGNSKRSDSVKS